jgi:hypothetical protein
MKLNAQNLLFGFLILAVFIALPHKSVRAADNPQVATVDAALGPCSADFIVKDGASKPLYGAKISVAIKYGFMNKRETDLDASTNSNGEALFTGLPKFPKKPLEFTVASATSSKTVTDDPQDLCRAILNVTLDTH